MSKTKATKARSKRPVAERASASNVTSPVASSPAVILDRVLRQGTCRTLNNKGELRYCVGVDAKGEPQLRIVENTGGSGSFSDAWVPFKAIQAAFDRAPKDKPVTAYMLLPIFRGKSSNCPYFTAAVLVSEGLLKPSATRRRRYDRVDPAAWLAELSSLADGGGAAGKKAARTNVKEVDVAKPKKSKRTVEA